jgi:hypothetical protein
MQTYSGLPDQTWLKTKKEHFQKLWKLDKIKQLVGEAKV